jgi:DNA-binding NtrC family response regulator
MPRIVLINEAGRQLLDQGCARALANHGRCEIRTCEELALNPAELPRADVIVACAEDEGGSTVHSLRWLRMHAGQAPLLAIVPATFGDEQLQRVSEIANDLIVAPFGENELRFRMAKILGSTARDINPPRRELVNEACLAQLIGRHPAFLLAVEKVRLYASTGAPVLITGETGTGKELFAHAIHSLSARRDGPFIPADCSSLPEALVENELFGHRRGAFTDAHSDQKGLAGMAEHGTLFLDELDALSPSTQSKLLRFVQEGSYRSLGADRFTPADVRIIAATNRSLEECVQKKQFRSDLYYRLNVLRLDLPALRDRAGDVTLLAKYFAATLSSEGQIARKTVSAAALQKVEDCTWPGNVRELLNVMQRACVFCSGPEIQPHHIVFANPERDGVPVPFDGNFQAAKKQLVARFERDFVERLLLRHNGNVTQAAREAGKERRAFGRMVKKYGIALDAGGRPGHF